MNRWVLSMLVCGAALGASAQIALDSAEDAVYIVGQEYIQVGTPPGDQTAATNGLNGGFGFERWQRGGYGDNGNYGSTKITNVSPSFNMGSKQFGLRSGVGGLDYSGADARRRLLKDMALGEVMSFSLMPGGGGAGEECTVGDFGVEFRGPSLSNPGRDLVGMNASKGQNYSLQDASGSIFTGIPVVPGQRLDVKIVSYQVNKFTITLTPYGGLPETYVLTSISSAQNAPLRTVQFYAYQTNGDSYVNFLKVMPPTVPVTGNVSLQDYAGAVAGRQVAIDVVNAGGTVVESHTATLDASGNYTISTAVQGSYKIAAKASHWLRSMSATITIGASGASNVNFSLVNGDVDGDNAVTVFDYNLLSDAFDSSPGDGNWNAEADLDGDEAVTVFDYNILSQNFDVAGD